MDKLKPTPIKYTTLITKAAVAALESVYTDEYPVPQFQNLTVVHRFANEEENYPLILVRWHPNRVWNAGIDHFENLPDAYGFTRKFRHFLFDGQMEFVVMARTVYDYQLLLDSVVDLFAFGQLNTLTDHFFEKIYRDEDFLNGDQITLMTDSLQVSSMDNTPVPWGSDDQFIFQSSIMVEAFGGFYSAQEDNVYHFVEQVILNVRKPSEPDFTHSTTGWTPTTVSEDSGYVKGETIISNTEDTP